MFALNKELLKLPGKIFESKSFYNRAVRVKKEWVERWDMVATV